MKTFLLSLFILLAACAGQAPAPQPTPTPTPTPQPEPTPTPTPTPTPQPEPTPQPAPPLVSGSWNAITPNLRDVPGWPTRADLPKGPDGTVYMNGGIQGDRCILVCYSGAYHIPPSAKYPNGGMGFHGGGHSHGTSVGIYVLAFGPTPKIVQEAPEFNYDKEVTSTTGTATFYQPSQSAPAAHTYGSLVYVDGRYFVQPQFIFTPTGMDGASPPTPYYWEWDGTKWLTHEPRIEHWTTGVYDPKAGLIYMSGNISDYMTFDPKTNTAVQKGSLFYDKARNNSDTGLVYDPDDDLIWALSHGTLHQVSLKDGAPMLVGSPVDVPDYTGGNAGLEYHARSLWVWTGDSLMREYDLETGEWTTYSPGSGPACKSRDIFSKFMWSEYYQGFVAACDTLSPVYVFKPGDTPSPQPTPQPEPTPQPTPQPNPNPSPAGFTIPTDTGLPAFNPSNNVSAQPAYPCGIAAHLGQTGDQLYIGITTEWGAQFLAGRRDLYDTIMCQGDLKLWDDPYFQKEFAHTPSIYWIPWLMTHDPKYADEMVKQLKAFEAWKQADFSKHPKDFISLARNTAWQLRNLVELAAARPEYEPLLDSVRDVFLAEMADGQKFLTLQNKEGWIFWEQGMLTQALAHVVLLGHKDWLPILKYQLQFLNDWPMKAWDASPGFQWTGDGQDVQRFLAQQGLDQVTGLAQDHPNSKNIRAHIMLAGLGMAAEAGADTCGMYTAYKDLVMQRAGGLPNPSRTNPVVNCP